MGKDPLLDEISEEEYNRPNSLNKKHLLGCLIIILLLGISSATVAGIFWWQKGTFIKNKKDNSLANSNINTDKKRTTPDTDIEEYKKQIFEYEKQDRLSFDCEKMIYPEEIKECYQENEIFRKAKTSKDLGKLCEIQQQDRDYCYSSFAYSYYEDSYCYKIKDESIREDCFDKMAIQLGDVDLCKEITTLNNAREECMIEVAKVKNDPKICNLIPQTDSRMRETCLEYLANKIHSIYEGIKP